MGYTLGKFASECHAILAEDSGVAGREKVRALLCDVLVDETFVEENFLGEQRCTPISPLRRRQTWFCHLLACL